MLNSALLDCNAEKEVQETSLDAFYEETDALMVIVQQ